MEGKRPAGRPLTAARAGAERGGQDLDCSSRGSEDVIDFEDSRQSRLTNLRSRGDGKKKIKDGPGQVAQLVTALSQYANVAGSILVRAHTRVNK